MIEAGVVVGYLIAWAVRKARRAAGRLDSEADAVIDAGLDKLHKAVTARLGSDPALAELSDPALVNPDKEVAGREGWISESTHRRLESAVAAAAREDNEFGRSVRDLVLQLRVIERAGGFSVVAGAGGRVFTGDAHATASGPGIAIGQVGGDVSVADVPRQGPNPSGSDPFGPGRSRH